MNNIETINTVKRVNKEFVDRAPRYTLNEDYDLQKVQFVLAHDATSLQDGELVDISPTGLLIKTKHEARLNRDDLLMFECRLPGINTPMIWKGKVVRSEIFRGKQLAGIEFLNMPDAYKSALVTGLAHANSGGSFFKLLSAIKSLICIKLKRSSKSVATAVALILFGAGAATYLYFNPASYFANEKVQREISSIKVKSKSNYYKKLLE